MRILVAVIVVFAAFGVGLAAWLAWPHEPGYVHRRSAVFNDREVEFLVIDASAPEWEWTIGHAPDAPKNVAGWRTATGSDAVVNAAYFNPDFTPSGYFSVDSMASAVPWPTTEEQQEKGSYSFLVQIVQGDMRLAYLPEQPRSKPEGDVLLSFPTLVAGGEAMVEQDSYRLAARTILAEDADGHDYIILTEKGSVSLYEAAQWLAEQPEQFVTAGNLDGGPSTGVSLENGWFDVERSSSPVPSVLMMDWNDAL